ncbi:Trp family transcriptional regulator [Burkholderia sp. AU45274]|uniref:Trp family transcriptional regulator n=1 Tax=Burkholderia sp. AU45274 TaxID=3059205 RepID=UPI00264EEB98|nr:Trp family transcriptional regulator [Burkholderia sp. AU45274]MDN7490552.1 Trp family transcriptional regulator [Burkholderia sp. AU45274]
MAEMYRAGSKMAEIAKQFGCSTQRVSQCLACLGIVTRRGNWMRRGRNDQRREQVFEMLRNGKNQTEIAAHFGISSTRISHYVDELKVHSEKYASILDDAQRAQFEIKCGLSLENFPSFDEAKKAWDAFSVQRSRAAYREIAWEMTFPEWWKIWSESGHWAERGRAHIGVYVMARFGDSGPYKVGNVEIITHSQNVSDSWKNVDRRVTRNELGQLRSEADCES